MAETRFTKGPWQWQIHPKNHTVTLCARRGWGDEVLSARRWGMGGATLYVREVRDKEPVLLTAIHTLAVPIEGREHHKDWILTTNHPDMALIEAAPEMYEALELALGRLLSLTNESAIPETLLKIRAALAKARGEA